MAEGLHKTRLKLCIAWWLRPYLWCLVFVAVVMRMEPDYAKLARVCERAIRWKVLD